jgi:HK97 family phage portal protein
VRNPLAMALSPLLNRSPVPLAPAYTGGATNLSMFSRPAMNDERYLNTYGEVGTIFAIVSRIAAAQAAVPWHLYRKAKSGLKEDRVEVTSHAALDLWNKPNPFMPRQEFVEVFAQHLELVGETDWVIGKFGTIPVELWPVRPDRITPVPDPYTFLKGYIYRGPEGQDVPLDLNELIQVKMPNPLDPYRGLGPIQSILTTIDTEKYSAEWNRNFFLNSAEPGGIIEVDHLLEDKEFDQLTRRWREQHKGVSKAHRVAVLENGAKWVDRKFTMRDMQFAELATIGRDKALEAFGFPKAMLGIAEDVNRANAEAAEYLFAKWLTVPRLERIKGSLNHDLLPMFTGGEGLEFDYDSPVSENSEQENASVTARSAALALLADKGFDVKDVLSYLGLPDIKYEKPAPPTIVAPPGAAGAGKKAPAEDDPKALLQPENAQKWVAVEEDDDSTCQPCKDNRGKTYRNREDAYKDYPEGKGYRLCVGAEYGNECRGHVKKRRADDA